VDGNRKMCELLRSNADFIRQQNAEVENLSHFLIDMKEPIPASGETFVKGSKQEVAAFLAQKSITLEQKILKDGDCRHFDLKSAVPQKMAAIWSESQKFLDSDENFTELWFKEGGVDRSRLPKNPKTEDFFYEHFFQQCVGSQTRLLISEEKEKIRSIRKEQLPSWMVWQELDMRMRQLPKAEIGNIEDREIASFIPYVDLVNVDKRVREIFRQLSRENQLFSEAYKRVPEKPGVPGLIEALEKN
jgi:hypothetical protein